MGKKAESPLKIDITRTTKVDARKKRTMDINYHQTIWLSTFFSWLSNVFYLNVISLASNKLTPIIKLLNIIHVFCILTNYVFFITIDGSSYFNNSVCTYHITHNNTGWWFSSGYRKRSPSSTSKRRETSEPSRGETPRIYRETPFVEPSSVRQWFEQQREGRSVNC